MISAKKDGAMRIAAERCEMWRGLASWASERGTGLANRSIVKHK